MSLRPLNQQPPDTSNTIDSSRKSNPSRTMAMCTLRGYRYAILLTFFFQVPVVSTIMVAIMSAFMALLFSLSTLVEFIAIGQLMACTFVATCVIKLRYIPNNLSR